MASPPPPFPVSQSSYASVHDLTTSSDTPIHDRDTSCYLAEFPQCDRTCSAIQSLNDQLWCLRFLDSANFLFLLQTYIFFTISSLPYLQKPRDAPSIRLASGRGTHPSSERTTVTPYYVGSSSTSDRSSGSNSLHRSISSYHLSSTGLRNLQTTANSSGDARTYHLEVVQQPEITAEFRAAALSRLPVAPPLFVQLIIRDFTGNVVDNEPDLPFFIAHLSLCSADGMTILDDSDNAPFPPNRLLYGNIVSSPHSLRNLHGSLGIYFLFPDVSIRYRGSYSLRVSLMRLSSVDASGMIQVGQSGVVLAYTHTRPFEVRDRSTYVAPPQTALTEFFLQQGARIP